MNIEPLNNNTMLITRNIIELKGITKKNNKNGLPPILNSVISKETFKQYFKIIFSSIGFLISAIYITLLSIVYKTPWYSYIGPIIGIMISLPILFFTLFDFKNFRASTKNYEEDYKIDNYYTPVFLTNIFKKAIENQIKHNWITISLLFYGSIFTGFLYWLKDVSWWILDFKKWIKDGLVDPNTWVIILTVSLILIFALHMIFAIGRKNTQSKIQSFIQEPIMSLTDRTLIEKTKNKFYRRLFLLSVMLITLIPIVIYLIIRKKRRR